LWIGGTLLPRSDRRLPLILLLIRLPIWSATYLIGSSAHTLGFIKIATYIPLSLSFSSLPL
ncbi:hypothetical protein FRC19_003302, partial [Serendipita sp. 401]